MRDRVTHGCLRSLLVALTLTSCVGVGAAANAAPEVPETVIITYQVKPGADAELSRAIAEHWRLAQHLNLVLTASHIVVKGGGQDSRYILEILTWRSSKTPDNAPDAITRLWTQMGQYVVSRDGRPGIDLAPVSVLMQQNRP